MLVAAVNPALAPVNEKLLAASAEIVRLVNVATPATAAIDAFVNVPVPVARLSVTVAVDGITFPPPSSSLATTTGENVAPEATVVGWTVKTTFVAWPNPTLNVVLVAGVNPELAAENEKLLAAAAVTVNVEKVAMPLAAVTVAFASVPVPVARVNATEADEVGMTLPPVSSTFTTTSGENREPEPTADGCVVNASSAAVPTVTLNTLLVAEVNPLLAALNEKLFPANAVTVSPVNVAMPLAAVAVAFANVPAPVASVNAIDADDVATTFPPESSTFTTTTGENAAPFATDVGCVVNASIAAAPTVTLNVLLVADVNPLLAAFNEKLAAASAVTVRPVNVATPLTAVADAFASVPVPVASVNAIGADDVATTLLPESSTFTTTTGENAAPDATFDGCTVNARCVAAPTDTLNVLLVAEVNPVLAAVNEKLLAASADTVNVVNVATPLAAVTVAFASAPVPVASVNAIDAEDVPTILPPESSTLTTTTGENAAPDATFDGCVVKASFAAAPSVTLNGLLVADVNPLLAAVNEKPLPATADTVNVVNVAIPFTAVADAFVSVPVPVASVNVTTADDVTTTLPPESSTFTTTTGENAAPEATFDGCTENASCVAVAATTLNVLLVVEINPELAAVNEKLLAANAATLNVVNVATPLTAVTVAFVNTPVPVASVNATDADDATTLPPESSTFTTTTGENAAPLATVVGCVVNANAVAAPTVTLNVLLVAEVNPLLAAVNENPLPAIADTVNAVNVATPFTAVTLAFANTPVPVASVNAIGADDVATTFPPESSTFTTTAGENAAPDPTVDGCVVNANLLAAPTVTLNVLLVAVVNPLLAAANEKLLAANADTVNVVNVATPLDAVALAFATVPVPRRQSQRNRRR